MQYYVAIKILFMVGIFNDMRKWLQCNPKCKNQDTKLPMYYNWNNKKHM